MLYFFCDEDPSGIEAGRFRFATVCFQQNRFNNGLGRFQALRDGGGSLLAQIQTDLALSDGFSIVSEVTLPPSLVPPRSTCETTDIPKMARRDFVWSLSLIMTVGAAFRRALEKSWSFSTVDVYYDPKSLTFEHRASVNLVLQRKMKLYAAEYLARYHRSLSDKVTVRRVKEVPKAKRESPDKFQLGVWLADRIVRRFEKVKRMAGGGVFELEELTDLVVSTLSKV